MNYPIVPFSSFYARRSLADHFAPKKLVEAIPADRITIVFAAAQNVGCWHFASRRMTLLNDAIGAKADLGGGEFSRQRVRSLCGLAPPTSDHREQRQCRENSSRLQLTGVIEHRLAATPVSLLPNRLRGTNPLIPNARNQWQFA
jgi:hypothetical protein